MIAMAYRHHLQHDVCTACTTAHRLLLPHERILPTLHFLSISMDCIMASPTATSACTPTRVVSMQHGAAVRAYIAHLW